MLSPASGSVRRAVPPGGTLVGLLLFVCVFGRFLRLLTMFMPGPPTRRISTVWQGTRRRGAFACGLRPFRRF